MQKFLTSKSIFFSKSSWILLILFLVLRPISFLLAGHLIIQGILVFLLLMTLGILYFKNPNWAWYLVLGELFLGGAGHYIELMGLSIRTLLIVFFLFLWASHHLGQRILIQKFKIHKYANYLIIFLFIFIALAFFNGLANSHGFRQVVADVIPFSFLLLIFPSFHLFKDEKVQKYLIRLLVVFVIGTAIFSLTAFTLFSTGATEIHNDFYKWYRDVDMGKITDMGTGFFRIVEPGHLLAVPIILLITSLLMRDEKHHKMWRLVLILSIIILVLNLSRGYFLALVIGLLVLKYKHSWKQWIKESAYTILLIIVIFSGVHLIASGGGSLGWELFGMRIKSFAQPQIEISTATRMMALPEIMSMIKQNPVMGSGFGASVTFIDMATYETVTKPHFDWGYLEMWVEMGILGALSLIAMYIFVIRLLLDKTKKVFDYHDFDVGLLAGIISLLIMNITVPALFHVFGILFLVFALTIAVKHTSIFEHTTVLLYRIFNRLKIQ